jgi:hypothetical protein
MSIRKDEEKKDDEDMDDEYEGIKTIPFLRQVRLLMCTDNSWAEINGWP